GGTLRPPCSPGREQPWCVASAVFRLESGHNGPEIACQRVPGRLWTVRKGSFAPSIWECRTVRTGDGLRPFIWELSVRCARALDRRLPRFRWEPTDRVGLGIVRSE